MNARYKRHTLQNSNTDGGMETKGRGDSPLCNLDSYCTYSRGSGLPYPPQSSQGGTFIYTLKQDSALRRGVSFSKTICFVTRAYRVGKLFGRKLLSLATFFMCFKSTPVSRAYRVGKLFLFCLHGDNLYGVNYLFYCKNYRFRRQLWQSYFAVNSPSRCFLKIGQPVNDENLTRCNYGNTMRC